jgi:uroporphyrinogen-III synthase
MPSDDKVRLSHATVLVTRPRAQSAALSEQLEDAGARVIHFPVIDIVPVDIAEAADGNVLRRVVERLDSYAVAIFISTNAVIHADRIVGQLLGDWPRQLRLAVIGPGSARALADIGLQAEICPAEQFNSEGLLALPALQQVRGQRILIFRGKGGRETLATELRQRGAHVDYAEVYRRCRPTTRLEDLPEGQRDSISAIIVASNESLQNLYDLAGERWRSWLQQVPLIVISRRSEALARDLGFKYIVVANQATNEAMFEAVSALPELPRSGGKG